MSAVSFSGESATAAGYLKDQYDTGAEKAKEMTRDAVETVRQSTLVQRLIVPPTRFVVRKYNDSPVFLKFSLATFAAMSAIPIACFLGFMSIVAVSLLLVGGIAFAVIEGGFGLFASMFLFPALGVSLLVAGGVGVTFLFMYASYLVIAFGIGVVRGRGDEIDAENRAEGMRTAIDRRMAVST
ncbi:hypothetical protein DFQ27_005410 [Actinomortierella ambigua]|uniref:Uncharacterized protein n=1 Tax=Actinomortierella ambigua TaxID=1343610 RepID=A0A9P6Q269_9FUNG|nr:hypothetical protein DFQ27_005410 [Actinomortierella ambigua]